MSPEKESERARGTGLAQPTLVKDDQHHWVQQHQRMEPNKDTNAILQHLVLPGSCPAEVIGHHPKSKSPSSERVQGFQRMTTATGQPLNKKQRRRDRKQRQKRKEIGSQKFESKSDKKRAGLFYNTPKTDNGRWKFDQLAPPMKVRDNDIGSWKTPMTSDERSKLLAVFQEKSLTEEYLRGNFPVFFCGDGSSHIDGIPSDSTVIAVDNLFVIDTIDGFKFPFDPDEQDKVLLVRRREVVAENFQPNHPRLLDALDAISNLTKNSGLKRGKDRIVAFQEGSNNKYLTPGIFPLRTACGTGIRSLKELEAHHHDAIFRYVKNCETLALNSMSTNVVRGVNLGKQMFPFPTFPGVEIDQKTRIYHSIAAASNVCLNSHKDVDSFYGVVTNMEADKNKLFSLYDAVTSYFTFPTLGFAVALRPGDILYFNPTIYHSVSSRRDPQKNIWCTSLYTKNAVVGGNDNSVTLDFYQKEVMDNFNSMFKK